MIARPHSPAAAPGPVRAGRQHGVLERAAARSRRTCSRPRDAVALSRTSQAARRHRGGGRRRPRPWRLRSKPSARSPSTTRAPRASARWSKASLTPRTSMSATACAPARCWPGCTATRSTTAGATTARPSPIAGASSRNSPSPPRRSRGPNASSPTRRRRRSRSNVPARPGPVPCEHLAVANAEVQRARESLEHLGIPTGSTTEGRAAEIIPVRTPQAGVVLEKLVTTGTTVTPGTPLFVVSDTSSLWVLAEIDEAALAQVKVGAPAQVRCRPIRPSASRRRSRRLATPSTRPRDEWSSGARCATPMAA